MPFESNERGFNYSIVHTRHSRWNAIEGSFDARFFSRSISDRGDVAAVESTLVTPILLVTRADLAAIDGEPSNVLATLGVTVGDADTWVRTLRCGQGALVN